MIPQNVSISLPLAITTGCPSGIGPEVSVAAASLALQRQIPIVLLGDLASLQQAARVVGVSAKLVAVSSMPSSYNPGVIPVFDAGVHLEASQRVSGRPSKAGGRAQLAWIDAATDLVADHQASAIVTGPVSKDVIASCGAPGAESFAGHTEYIARRINAGPPVMTFVADDFTVGLVTTHLALANVPSAITRENVAYTCVQVSELVGRLKRGVARVVVAALNPHAGENGMFGLEEQQVIRPAVEDARRLLSSNKEGQFVLDGPLGAEAAFRLGMDGRYDAVVAMYHDQGTIPMKVRFFGKAVNVTAGLPIVRTSVDHGTAYDIAGKGSADPGSMLAAMILAQRLVQD